jgi:hypothetical protein
VLVLIGAIALLPRGAALFVSLDDPRWSAVHDRWGVLLLAAGGVLLIGAGARR